MEEENNTAPPLAMASIIFGMALMAIASGLTFTYIPIELTNRNFPSWLTSTMITAVAFGGFIGCLTTGWTIRNSGHARVFATALAGVILSFVFIALSANVWVWLLSRFIYGASINCLFIVSQSWLHNSSSDEWRGKVMSVFHLSYVFSLGIGAFLLRFMDISTTAPMLIAISCAALAIIPVGLTRLPQPPAPPQGSFSIRKVWKIAPVGLAGMMTVGGLTMLIQGFGPIWAAQENFSKDDIALMMSLMQLGMVFVQLPLGTASDYIDRRIILIATSAIVAGIALFSLSISNPTLWVVIACFAVWSGASETIYSVSNALSNDRADPNDYVMLSSTLLFAWSFSAFVIPVIGTVVTSIMGPTAFMWVSIVFAGIFGTFTFSRMFLRPYEAKEETESLVFASAQVAYQIEPFETEEEYASSFWTEAIG